MPRRMRDDYEWGDEESRPGDEAADADDDAPTQACPYCRREIYEDAERCPYCENYISDDDAPPPRKPWWIIVGALACLYVVYRWITG